MWERYKRELAEQERNTEDFLAKFYRTHNPDFRRLKSLGRQLGETEAGLGETEPEVGQEQVLTLHHFEILYFPGSSLAFNASNNLDAGRV